MSEGASTIVTRGAAGGEPGCAGEADPEAAGEARLLPADDAVLGEG